MHERVSRRTSGLSAGIALVSLVPWIVAVGGFVFGLTAWLTRSSEGPRDSRAITDSADLQSIRLALEASRGENQALRRELDRLLNGGRLRSNSEPASGAGTASRPAAGAQLAQDPRFQELTKRLQQSLSRLGTGDREAAQSVAIDLFGVVREGRDALPALLDVYMGLSNPEAKKVMLAPMLFIGGPEARDFVLSQAESETDPGLKKLLLDQAAKYATPEVADRLTGTFVERLQSDDDSSARLTAVRGLRYARAAEAESALLKAAHDHDQQVRLAAIDVLAARPKMRQQVRDLAADDPSAHVREVAQCRLMVADNMP
jgi:hypothetical protein